MSFIVDGKRWRLIACHHRTPRQQSYDTLFHRRLSRGDQLRTVDLGRYLEELSTDMTSSIGSDWTGRISFKTRRALG
jgi:hypothetical protein